MDLNKLRGRVGFSNNGLHKPFQHNWKRMPKAEREERGGKRFYRTPDGNLYPSVTTFTGTLDDDPEWYDRWAKKLGGYDKAEAESNRCADRGTGVHLALETLILNQPDPYKHAGAYVHMFRQLEFQMRNNLSEVWCLETALYSHKLKLAGTVDCAGVWKGIPSVIDFKTANDLKRSEHIEDYFFQATCYAIMLEEHFKIEVPQIVIAIAVEQDTRPQIITRMKSEFEPKLWVEIKKFHANQDFYPIELNSPLGAFFV